METGKLAGDEAHSFTFGAGFGSRPFFFGLCGCGGVASIRLITSSRRSAVGSDLDMDDPFDSPRLMIEGAKEHIACLKEGIEAFLSQDNWTGFVQVDPETGDHICAVQFKTDLPRRLPLEVYRITGPLRSALDQAAYASAVLTSGRDDPSRTKFIFGDTPEDLANEIKAGRCKDMHKDVIALMLAFEPHEAGNRPLWALNKMRNRSDHRVLSPCSATSGGLEILSGSLVGSATLMSEWKATRRQLAFLRVRAGAKFNMRVVPTLNVMLNPIFRFPSRPAADVLDDLAGEVERIVMAMEAETLRITGG